MYPYLGDFPTGQTIYIPWHTFDSNDPTGSVTMTGLALADIKVYKNGGTTQRASTAGYTLLDTDGTDFDGMAGIHGISIDTSDNTDAGFYVAQADYWVVIDSVTVDAGTVRFIAATFSIDNRGLLRPTTVGRTLDVTATGAAGVDWGNVENQSTSVDLSATTTNLVNTTTTNTDMRGTDSALLASSAPTNFGDLAITVTTGQVTVGTNNDKTGYSVVGLNDPTAAAIADAVWDETLADHLGAGSTGNALNAAGAAGDPWSTALPGAYGAGTAGNIVGNNLDAAVSTTATAAALATVDLNVDAILVDTGTTLPASLATIDANVDAILVDTGTDGVVISAATANQIADALLNRDMSLVSDTNARTPLNALRFMRNKYSISGTTLTVTKEDDTTVAWTASLTVDAAADPVTGSDPA